MSEAHAINFIAMLYALEVYEVYSKKVEIDKLIIIVGDFNYFQ